MPRGSPASRGSAPRSPARRAGSGAAGLPRSRGRRTGRPGSRRSGARRRGTPGRPGAPPRAPRGRPSRSRRSTMLSSSVTTRRLPRAWSRISWRSSGLANRALMTPTDQPSAARASAASIAPGRTIGPKPTSRTSRALAEHLAATDRQDLGLALRDAEPRVARVVQGERVVLGERGPDHASAAPARPWGWRSRGSAAGAGPGA